MKLPKPDKLEQKAKRICIRPLRLSDFNFWKKLQDTMAVPQNKFDIPPAKEPAERTLKVFKNILKRTKTDMLKGADCFWGVFLKDNRLIGRVGLINITRDTYQSAEITYRIFNPFWGHKYAQEAITAYLKLAFTKLKLNRIEAYVEPVNKASIRAAEASGLKKEGLAKKKLFTRDEWRDMLIYAAVCSDYGFNLNPPEL